MTEGALFAQYAIAFLLPLIAVWLLTPATGKLAHRFGILDHPSEERYHASATPYLGGAVVALGLMLVGSFVVGASWQLVAIVTGAIGLMLIGLLDDRFGLRPWIKLLMETLAAVGLWASGVRGAVFDVAVLDLAVSVLWVLAITNALNLLDNMDGLAAGVTAIASTTYFVIAAAQGDYLVGSLAIALAGASLGFLRHNFPPARIFLGDAGSLMLGFLLAALALKLDLVGGAGITRLVIPIMILGVPIFDTLLVIIARTREGRPVFLGGTDHSSHRLTELGLSGTSVALATYTAQLLLCGAALLLVNADPAVVVGALMLVLVIAAFILGRFLGMPAPNGARRD